MNIALLGGGLMGQALAQRLIAQQQNLTVFNRSQEKVEDLQAAGVRITETPAEAIEHAELVILMLSDAEAIDAILATIKLEAFEGKLFIQMGTIGPDESIDISEKIRLMNADYLECPVLGSLPEATSGTLILMAAGEEDQYQRALPLLQLLGKTPQYIGQIGQGAALKLAMNQLIAGLTSSFALSLALVEEYGIEIEQFMKILRESALYAPTFDKKLERMLNRHFTEPNFPIKHLAKDTQLFLKVAEPLRLDTSGLQGIAQLLDKTVSMGMDNADYSAIYAAVSPDRK